MIDQQESLPKTYISGLINKDELPNLEQWATAPILRFEPEILGHAKWQEALNATQKDNNERNISVYYHKGNLITGEILEGEQVRFDTLKETGKKNSYTFQTVRQYFRSLIKFQQELVHIHFHPKPAELDHLPTTILTDIDINTFLKSRQKAMVMVDIGGIHILARVPYSSHVADETDKPFDIANKAFNQSLKNEKSVQEVRTLTAKGLQPLGIRYYYSSNLSPNQNGLIEVTDVLR